MTLMTVFTVLITLISVPPKPAVKRILIPDDAEVWICASTPQGRTCRSAQDVRSFLRADDRECH